MKKTKKQKDIMLRLVKNPTNKQANEIYGRCKDCLLIVRNGIPYIVF